VCALDCHGPTRTKNSIEGREILAYLERTGVLFGGKRPTGEWIASPTAALRSVVHVRRSYLVDAGNPLMNPALSPSALTEREARGVAS
jgi:hypothetical protein